MPPRLRPSVRFHACDCVKHVDRRALRSSGVGEPSGSRMRLASYAGAVLTHPRHHQPSLAPTSTITARSFSDVTFHSTELRRPSSAAIVGHRVDAPEDMRRCVRLCADDHDSEDLCMRFGRDRQHLRLDRAVELCDEGRVQREKIRDELAALRAAQYERLDCCVEQQALQRAH